jgi:hypothetical protein
MIDILNITDEKEGDDGFDSLNLLASLSDEEILAIQKAGQLKTFCLALSVDLQPLNKEESKTYDA